MFVVIRGQLINVFVVLQLPVHQLVSPREPIAGYFQGEPVFLRRNVHELLSSRQWEELKNRVVIPGEVPIRRKVKKKRVPPGEVSGEAASNTNYFEKACIVIELYAIWQTRERCITPDGEYGTSRGAPIPCSQFGTVNLTGKRMVPHGCIHLKGMPGITYVVREMNTVPWRPAVVGFELNGKPKPVVDGIVIWEIDKDRVLEQYEAYRRRKQNFGFMLHRGRVRKLWQSLLKTLLGRYYVTVRDGRLQAHDRTSFRRIQQTISTHCTAQLEALNQSVPVEDCSSSPQNATPNLWEDV